MHCHQCGQELQSNHKFCVNCGTKTEVKPDKDGASQDEAYKEEGAATSADSPAQQAQKTELPLSSGPAPQEAAALTDLEQFVGKNYSYYAAKWDKSSNPASKAGWNWAAFFLGVFWMGYRKMYGFAALWVGFLFLVTVVEEVFNLTFISRANIAFWVVLGLLGNSLYYIHAKKKIAKVRSYMRLDPKLALPQAGGTSWLGVAIAALFVIVYLGAAVGVAMVAEDVRADKEVQSFINEVAEAPEEVSDTSIEETDSNAEEALTETGSDVIDIEEPYVEPEPEAASDETFTDTESYDSQSDYEWDMEHLYVDENGHIPMAVQLLEELGSLRDAADAPEPNAVFKAPWNYYGTPIQISGYVGIVQEFPPDSDVAYMMGGTASEVVIMCDDGTIVDAVLNITTGDMQLDDYVTIYGLPAGLVEAPNKLGGTTTELVLVGNDYDINESAYGEDFEPL